MLGQVNGWPPYKCRVQAPTQPCKVTHRHIAKEGRLTNFNLIDEANAREGRSGV